MPHNITGASHPASRADFDALPATASAHGNLDDRLGDQTLRRVVQAANPGTGSSHSVRHSPPSSLPGLLPSHLSPTRECTTTRPEASEAQLHDVALTTLCDLIDRARADTANPPLCVPLGEALTQAMTRKGFGKEFELDLFCYATGLSTLMSQIPDLVVGSSRALRFDMAVYFRGDELCPEALKAPLHTLLSRHPSPIFEGNQPHLDNLLSFYLYVSAGKARPSRVHTAASSAGAVGSGSHRTSRTQGDPVERRLTAFAMGVLCDLVDGNRKQNDKTMTCAQLGRKLRMAMTLKGRADSLERSQPPRSGIAQGNDRAPHRGVDK